MLQEARSLGEADQRIGDGDGDDAVARLVRAAILRPDRYILALLHDRQEFVPIKSSVGKGLPI